LLKEQGSYNLEEYWGHRGPVLRPRCIRPGGARTPFIFLFYSKGLTGIQQSVVLWKGDDSNDEQVKVCGMEFCIKHAVLLRSGYLYLLMYNKESVV